MTMKSFGIALGVFGALFLSGLALAASSITVEAPWARTTPPVAKNGAVFLTLRNSGPADDVLLGASSDAAARVELHESKDEGGIMKMRSLESVTVPAGGSVDFKPGGKHFMLIDLKGPLVKGKTLGLTLTFKSAGTQSVVVEIADGPAMDAMKTHH